MTNQLDLSQFDGHTPGPWGVDDDQGITEPSGGYVGSVRLNSYCDLSVDPDARLIAAAPDLLAELKELRSYKAEMEGRLNTLRKWEKDRQLTEVHPQAKVALMIMEDTSDD